MNAFASLAVAATLALLLAGGRQLLGIMKAFKEVKEKDVIALDFVDAGTRISWNGAAKGSVPGAALNQALTRIWLGEKSVRRDVKQALLGG